MNPTKSPIQISVALVTRNRPESLERTLKSLRAQSVQPYEVIVSDDSGDEHRVAVERVTAQYGCRTIRGPQRGLYANRNHVALACRGTHIRTMDDDHEFIPDHFACCLATVETDPDSIWISSENPEDYGGIVCPGQLHPRGFSTLPPDGQNSWAFADGASIYPRAIFDSGLRYAEEFRFGAAYLEFGSRLHYLGYRIRHIPKTYIIHHFEAATRSYQSREIDLAARYFAMLCHSFLYQPSLANRTLTCLEVVKQTLLYRTLSLRALRAGMAGYRRQRSRISEQRARLSGTRLLASRMSQP
jgi:glycosyltransferase involved in cell wall biosynthesis